jgi:hypothetical protein
MPFPPTPSVTSSNTPTPSVTASQTPTYSPTGTVCPGLTPTATSQPTPTTTPTPSVTPTINPTPSVTATNTSTPTNTPSETPIVTYIYLGRTTPDAGNSGDACSSYLTVRPYYSLKPSLLAITVGDRFYDSYPSTPTDGQNNWIALKSSGVGVAFSFQIDINGYVIQAGGAC